MVFGIPEIIAIIEFALEKGIPAVTAAVNSFKAKNGRDPSADEIRALKDGISPPDVNP